MFCLAILIVFPMFQETNAVQLPDLYWNTSNPMFDKGGAVMTVQLRDRIDIYCPHYDRPVRDPQYLAVYMVSSFGYKKCTIYDAKPVLICKNPYRANFVSVVFRKFTPNPNGLEFTPGKTYYFIAASSGDYDGIYNRKGGLCDKGHLRMRIKVKENNPEPPAHQDLDITFAQGVKLTRKDRYQLDEERLDRHERVIMDEQSSLEFTGIRESFQAPPISFHPRHVYPGSAPKSGSGGSQPIPENPLGKLYPKERARLRYLMEYLDRMRQTTTPSLPAIDYVIGYETNPEFLRSGVNGSPKSQAGFALLTVLPIVSLIWVVFISRGDL